MTSSKKSTPLLLYFSVLGIYIYSIKGFKDVGDIMKQNEERVSLRFKEMGAFRLHFFTNWTFMLQITFLITAILHEASSYFDLSVSLQKRLGRFRAFIFNALVFPCSCVVVTIFWSIWHVDRELIFPRELDQFFPNWLNHILHTFILVPMLVELSLPKKYHFVPFWKAAKVLFVYVTIYQLLYMSVYFLHGIWLYPIYGVLNWTQRILFTLSQLGLCFIYQKIGISIQNSKKPVKWRTA